MPIYEYLCESCAHEYEFLVAGGEAKPPCPRCGSDSVERVISRPAAPPSPTSSGPASCGPGG